MFFLVNPKNEFYYNIIKDYISKDIDVLSTKLLLGMENCQQIIGNIPFSIVVKDSKGRYIRLSQYLLDSLGESIDTFFGKTDEQIDLRLLSKFGKLCGEKKDLGNGIIEYQYCLEDIDGKEKYLLVREKTLTTKNDLNGLILSAGYDITNMTKLQKQIESQNKQMSEILDNLPTGAGYLSNDLIFQYVNPAFCEMYEAYPSHYIGRHLSFFYELTPNLESALHSLYKTGYLVNYELNSTTLNMRKIHVMLSAKILQTNGNIFFTIQDISEIKRLQNEIKFMAYNDCVTGLANRHSLSLFIIDKLNLLDRNQELLAILYIDLDGFKNINDTYGHNVGDELLKQVGGRLKSIIRSSDKIARVGGDEFVICLSRIKNESEIQVVISKIQELFEKDFVVGNINCKVGASIGISITNFDEIGNLDCEQLAELLLKQADDAMYTVKNSGKGDYCFYKKLK